MDRAVPAEEHEERLREAASLPAVKLGPRTLSNLEMISTGVFSPLEGFMGREEYESVVGEMRFPDGLPWSMPVTLPTDEETANSLTEGSEISLTDGMGEIVATMMLRERFRYDREREAREVYRTTDPAPPHSRSTLKRSPTSLTSPVSASLPIPPNSRSSPARPCRASSPGPPTRRS